VLFKDAIFDAGITND